MQKLNKNKLKSFFVFIALCFVSNLVAQQKHIVLPIDIQKPEYTFSNTKPSQRALEIVNLTGDSLTMGYTNAEDNGNDRVAIVATLQKEEYLTAIMGADADDLFAKRNKKGLYLIHDISIGRMPAVNYVRIKASLYESAVGSDAFVFVKNIDDAFSSNTDSLSLIPVLLKSAIIATITSVANVISSTVDTKPKTRMQVLQEEGNKYLFIKKNVFATGIYMSYNEFKQGMPSFSQFYVKANASSKIIEVSSFSITDSTLRQVKPWAIAVANELYLYNEGILYPMEAVGCNLVFSKYIDPNIRKNNSMFWRKNIGSQFAEFQDGNPFDNRYVFGLVNDHNKGIAGEATKIDGDSGIPAL